MRFATRVRVRYAETDAMGVVYYANFFVWMEVGRVELLRANGFTYKDFETRGLGLPVIEAQCRYRRPAAYDDVIVIESELTAVTQRKVTISYLLFREGEPRVKLAEGYTTHACVDATGKAVLFPQDVFEFMVKLMPHDSDPSHDSAVEP